ncbi:hypothetical protein FF38_13041 [Lucilia cuprina]|uniref:Uncharacterized protein n=1 Tax=Lucilia cuprina TaxID=7375 RepID=A0A0L0CEV2_LUCCU|nr:hypothetical protein FF38_13041 [Lucilia cuprina]
MSNHTVPLLLDILLEEHPEISVIATKTPHVDPNNFQIKNEHKNYFLKMTSDILFNKLQEGWSVSKNVHNKLLKHYNDMQRSMILLHLPSESLEFYTNLEVVFASMILGFALNLNHEVFQALQFNLRFSETDQCLWLDLKSLVFPLRSIEAK